MVKLILSSVLLLLLTACEFGKPAMKQWGYDQCERAKLFNQCMTSLPAGPAATKYNDWSEVVDACQDATRSISARSWETIKPECRDS